MYKRRPKEVSSQSSCCNPWVVNVHAGSCHLSSMLLLSLQLFIMLPLRMFLMSIPLAAFAHPSDPDSHPHPLGPFEDPDFYPKYLRHVDYNPLRPEV